MNRIVFLGSGGGRQMIATQERKTGGLYFEFQDDFAFAVDPGPGALVHAVSLGLKPEKWKGVVLSHHHPDACNDANVIIDAICVQEPASKIYPFIIAEEHCLKQGKGKDDPYPFVTKYHQEMAKKLFDMKAGDSAKVEKLEVLATKAWHYGPSLGFVFDYSGIRVGYPSDGSYYPGQEKTFEDCHIIILNAAWPKGHDAPKGLHMTLDDAITLVRNIEKKPKLVVLSHISPYMLRANLYKQERIFTEATKVRCISAQDFMELDLDTLKTRLLKPTQKT